MTIGAAGLSGQFHSTGGRSRPRVLVVDDERGPRESLRVILSPGCEVLLASGGHQAQALLREQPIDLVTLDLQMPGMHGRQLMQILRDEHPQIPVIVITGCSSVASATEGIRCGISDYLEKPFDVVQVHEAVARALSQRRARARLAGLLERLGDSESGDLGALFGEAAELDAGGALESSRSTAFLVRLAETLEAREASMSGHARRVAFCAELLAHRLGQSAQEHQQIYLAAILHDFGNAGVSPELLSRPESLADIEYEQIDEHARIGERLLESLALDAPILAAIRHHHEWWDGSGTPDGLRGAGIPLAARILAVTDAFDAMNSDRPYRAALPREQVIAELRRGAGHHFDPDLVKEFLAILETGVCELDPQWVAEVVSQATALDRLPPIS